MQLIDFIKVEYIIETVRLQVFYHHCTNETKKH